jgi:hypothetical protein
MTATAVTPRPPTFDTLEPRRLLSTPAPAIVLSVGDHDITPTLSAVDGRTGQWIVAGYEGIDQNLNPRARGVRIRAGFYGSDWNMFLVRYRTDGQPVWARGFDITGAAGPPAITAIAAGPDNSTYVAGTFAGTLNIAPTIIEPEVGQTLHSTPASDGDPTHAQDVFIVKYDGGGSLVFARVFSNVVNGTETATALVVDRFGSAYLAGASTAIDPTARVTEQAYVTKFDSFAGRQMWTRPIPRAASAAAIDHYDNLYLAQGGAKLDLGVYNGRGKFRQTLPAATPADWLQPAGTITARSIAFDRADNIVLSGAATRVFDFNPAPDAGAASTDNAGQFLLGDKRYQQFPQTNVFCQKLRPTGSLVFALTIAGPDADKAAGAAIDPATGDIILSGTYTGQVDFDPARRATYFLNAGYDATDGDYPSDVFTARYSPTGRLQWVTTHATTDFDTPTGLGYFNNRTLTVLHNYDQKQDQMHMIFYLQPT